MSNATSQPAEIYTKAISEVEVGEIVANLGEILEIEEAANAYTLVISRLGEKQVIKFEKQTLLILISSEYFIKVDMGRNI
ncbi:hypothetical protein [Pedobacter alluvionis]|uniref:Uncharacterized protein n=1 Tax=Pedobacter alluvionis TaxID=475253 RepID=A0A497YAX7_9SPHI|nr:hypothetical protein [Pedobacter alluvionis]RLJ77379.1 hypothetical protein BCL90_2465 [Pedobacter alluvionis]TFB33401.1 hypothetical protein E3V97_04975 [Pedobacter alluvionis]